MQKQDVKAAIENVARLYNELRAPFINRDEEARVLVMSLITREHALLLGEPGTAKSALARRLATLVRARFFKYLLTKYTEPSELLGPLDIRALKEGEYRRIVYGKLPEAEIAFLDEIFNANSAVLNSLLSIMQERIVYDGYSEIRTNLWTIIAASNNVPEEVELQALYDRFLFRHRIEPLSPEYWDPLLKASWEIEKTGYESPVHVMDLEAIRRVYDVVLTGVDVFMVKDKLIRLYMVLEDKGFHITDRRKGKILKAIAAHALLEGRTRATEQDLMVLKYTVPRDPEDFSKINTILMEELKTRDRILRELNAVNSNLDATMEMIDRVASFDPRLIDYYRSLKSTRSKVQSLVEGIDDPEIIRIASEIMEKIDNLIDRVMSKLNV